MITILVLSLLILSCTLTLNNLGYIDLFKSDFQDEIRMIDNSPSVEEPGSIYTYGVYKINTDKKVKPGKYKVDVKPVGNNITLNIIDSSHNYTKNFDDQISFEVDIDSTVVYIRIVISDPISYQNWTRGQKFVLDMKKIESNSSLLLLPLWSLVIIGGVYLAADAAYRRRFD